MAIKKRFKSYRKDYETIFDDELEVDFPGADFSTSGWRDSVGQKYNAASIKKLNSLYKHLESEWDRLYDCAERIDFFSPKAVEYQSQEEFIDSCWVD